MVTTKKTTEKTEKVKVECKDRLCPVHGDRKLKMRGRIFEGVVVKKLAGRVTIQFERMLKLPKYERYEKRKTKIHARLPDCMRDDVAVGDLIQIAETRPISKMIHFVVSKVKIRTLRGGTGISNSSGNADAVEQKSKISVGREKTAGVKA